MPSQMRIRTAGLPERLRGPWRVAVTEASMRPAIEPGDWLLVDPTVDRWPRRGSVVVFREPDSDALAIKRVAAGPGDRVPYADGYLILAADEAWLLSDANDAELMAAGLGEPVDSRRYGPVPVDLLVGRAWFRYAPLGRVGRIPRAQ
jgi:signal peptidase I